MNDRRLGTWIVTHVATSGRESRHTNGIFLAVALSGAKALAKVHLATALPYDELHATLIRRDAAPYEPHKSGPDLERYLGPLDHFRPRCRSCSGQGVVRGSEGGTGRCPACEGTGRLTARCTGGGSRGSDAGS